MTLVSPASRDCGSYETFVIAEWKRKKAHEKTWMKETKRRSSSETYSVVVGLSWQACDKKSERRTMESNYISSYTSSA